MSDYRGEGQTKTLTTSVICDFITVYSLSQQGVLYDVYSHIFSVGCISAFGSASVHGSELRGNSNSKEI